MMTQQSLNHKTIGLLVFGMSLLLAGCSGSRRVVEMEGRFQVLVFSKTNGYRHDVIPDGIAAIQRLGEEHNFKVEATEDSTVFTLESLSRYDAVIFLNTSGDILNEEQQQAFEHFIRAGGGFAGIHGATATEYEWPWYGELVGRFFSVHPEAQEAVIQVVDRDHPSTSHLPERWERFDEWYEWRPEPDVDVRVLAYMDESSYEGGTMGDDHPIIWSHDVGEGRSWYTGLGHTAECFSDPLVLEHLLGGIEWAAGVAENVAGELE